MQHIEICKQMMSESNRLRSLEMSVTGHQSFIMFFSNSQQSFFKVNQKLSNFCYFTFHIHMHIKRNLVITATRGMQTSTSLTNTLGQTCFNVHMDIFQSNFKAKVTCFNISEDIFQTSNNFFPVFCRNDAAFCKHISMRNAATNIFMI